MTMIAARARRAGVMVGLLGAVLALAGRSTPEYPEIRWIALGLIIIAATLWLAAITHRAMFTRIEIKRDKQE